MTTIPALVQTFATEARGSVGPFTFSRNRDGPYVRDRTVPIDPASAAQQFWRSLTRLESDRWRRFVSPAEKAYWRAYADAVPRHDALGQAFNDQPRNWYMACNMQRVYAGHPSIYAGPREHRRTALSPYVAQYENFLNLVFVWPVVTDEWRQLLTDLFIIYIGKEVSLNVNYYKGPWRKLGKITGTQMLPATFLSPWRLRPGYQFYTYARALTHTNLYSRRVYCRCRIF